MDAEQLKREIAAILVRLENGREDDARAMCETLIGDTAYHHAAYREYVEEFGEPGQVSP